MSILPALLLAAAPASAVGLYEIDQMEMAGGLELRADGRFSYGLDYGAVSEMSEGNWASGTEGDILLTTDPMPPAAECDRGFASACFRNSRLVWEKDELILYRWDAKIRLKPVQRAPSK